MMIYQLCSIIVDNSTTIENDGTAIITATIDAVQSKDVTILIFSGTAIIESDYSNQFYNF